MTKDIVKPNATTLTEILAEADAHTLSALRNSVYPGAKDESIAMVISYCKAKKYDPLKKPVHIVPMNVKNPVTGNYEWRDTIMRGINADREDASRTGQWVGLEDPEFGPDVTENLGGVEFTYPKWCKVTILKKMPDGSVTPWPAKVFWKENYANKGKNKSTGDINRAPNDMWARRPYEQLEKVAEARALRRAFSDMLTSEPTFEEMEGRDLHSHIEHDSTFTPVGVIDADQLLRVRTLIVTTKSDEVKMCQWLKIDCLESMTQEQYAQTLDVLNRKMRQVKNESMPINNVEPPQEASKNEADLPLNEGFESSDSTVDDFFAEEKKESEEIAK